MIRMCIELWMWRQAVKRYRSHPWWPLTARYIRPTKISRRNRPAWKGKP